MLLVLLFVVVIIVTFPLGPAAGLWLLGLWPGSLEPLRKARIPLGAGIIVLAGALVFVEGVPALLAEVSLIYRNFSNAETPQILSHDIYRVSFAIGYLLFLIIIFGGGPMEIGSIHIGRQSSLIILFLKAGVIIFGIIIAADLWNNYIYQIYDQPTRIGWRGFKLKLIYPNQPIMALILGAYNFFIGVVLLAITVELKRMFRKLRKPA